MSQQENLSIVSSVNSAVSTLQESTALLIDKAKQLAAHELLLGTINDSGHVKLGWGFERMEDGTVNINGTADFLAAMSALESALTSAMSAHTTEVDGELDGLSADVDDVTGRLAALAASLTDLDTAITGKLSAHAALAASTAAPGHVKLNNSVNSTSTTEAATASAVKQAYDKATGAQSTANNAASAANSAQSTANSAYSTANSAYSTANSAYNLASNAGGAPTPSSYSGKGQWVNVNFPTAYVTLPSGGTWAYHLANVNSASGAYYFSVSGVASGGSQINTLGAGHGVGLVWRVA